MRSVTCVSLSGHWVNVTYATQVIQNCTNEICLPSPSCHFPADFYWRRGRMCLSCGTDICIMLANLEHGILFPLPITIRHGQIMSSQLISIANLIILGNFAVAILQHGTFAARKFRLAYGSWNFCRAAYSQCGNCAAQKFGLVDSLLLGSFAAMKLCRE